MEARSSNCWIDQSYLYWAIRSEKQTPRMPRRAMDPSSLPNEEGTKLFGQWDGTTSGYLSIYSNTVWIATIAPISLRFLKTDFRVKKPFLLSVIKFLSWFGIFHTKCIDASQLDSMITMENICSSRLLLFIHCSTRWILTYVTSIKRKEKKRQEQIKAKLLSQFPRRRRWFWSSAVCVCIAFRSCKDDQRWMKVPINNTNSNS